MATEKRVISLRRVSWILGGLVLAVGFAFLFGIFVKLLWNWLMPAIFGLGEITYWQAWGLVILAHILFKVGGHGHDHDHGPDRHWKEKFRRKFKEGINEPEAAGHSEEINT